MREKKRETERGKREHMASTHVNTYVCMYVCKLLLSLLRRVARRLRGVPALDPRYQKRREQYL